jgi:DNA-directed RNA polymerase specialized sigma24 family protein
LHYQQGLSYAEAAQLLNVPENSLRVYAQRGIQRLRDKLTREGFSVD